jgi:hypothetical protein
VTASAPPYCDGCGRPPAEGDHTRCEARRGHTDPPRYCPDCGRRMVVQVLPLGWTARCSAHGTRTAHTT